MADKKYEDMTEDELAEARIKLREVVDRAKAEMKAIQNVIDARYVAPDPRNHTIGIGGVSLKGGD